MYVGAVGDDDLAEQLKEANKREGLDQVYQVKKGEKTGACAVIITGHSRYVSPIHSECVCVYMLCSLFENIFSALL